MKKYIFVFLILIVFVSCKSISEEDFKELCFEKKCINVQIRDSPQERQLGLMGRDNLPENEGMLFVFEKAGKYSFWMKNMKIDIDMIWLDENKNIIYIEHSVPPCTKESCSTYGPSDNSLYVVETASGFSEKYGLKIGDNVVFT